MASIKALCLAGVASLAVTVAASHAAYAADLLLPPAPPVYTPLPSPVFDGAVYLRGDVGVGIADLGTRQSTFDYAVPDVRYEQSSLDDSGIIDVGVGYRFNNFFRADITGEYRTAAHFSAVESYNQGAYNNPPDGSRGYDTYSASIRSVVGLVNGYVDAGTWYGVTPFVGAGVGVANVQVSNMIDLSPGGGFGLGGTHNQNNFAFALMAGLDFQVTQNLALELGYRYLNMGNVSSGAIACVAESPCPNEVQHYKLQSNDIRLGFRYTFANLLPPPPLVRKY